MLFRSKTGKPIYWFNKLDPFDLSEIPSSQRELDLRTATRPKVFPIGSAPEIYREGLQAKGTRHASQFKILYWFWRRGISPEAAENFTWRWIREKNNGFSETIKRYPDIVRKEIQRQAAFIWERYDLARVYPDRTHISYEGYISKPDIERIVKLSKANLPRINFLFNLVKYANPRRHRALISIHSDKLKIWSRHNKLEYLDELQSQGILQRGDHYQVGGFSKCVRFIDWNFQTEKDAVLFDGRSVEELDGAIKLLFSPNEFGSLLKAAGEKGQRVWYAVKKVYENEDKTESRDINII